jgi:hypothetical protein
MKYKGTKEDLVGKINSIGYEVTIVEKGSATQFRTIDGAIVNWYAGTGTINYQGDSAAAKK